jgi:hypothetical protein
MDEVAPKLAVYEPLVEPAREAFEALISFLKERQSQHRGLAPDRVLIHRQIISNYAKLFEILEYLGFLDASRSVTSHEVRWTRSCIHLNLCNLIDGGAIPSRLTSDMINALLDGSIEPAEDRSAP